MTYVVDGPTSSVGSTTAISDLSVTTTSHHGSLSPAPPDTANYDSPVLGPSEPPSPSRAATWTADKGSQNIINHPTRGRTTYSRKPSTAVGNAIPTGDRYKEGDDKSLKLAPVGKIGVCALDSKARSKPSRNILNRLVQSREFEVAIFGDKVILDEDVENWPICDFLISFFSEGFPLDKAIAYAKLRKPFCVNDLPMQTVLWDRRTCLAILDTLNVPTPHRVLVSRDGGPTAQTQDIAQRIFERVGLRLPVQGAQSSIEASPQMPRIRMLDDNDTIEVDGVRLTKPFVEKPTSGEDHNIYIYFAKNQGGGGRRLFRKVNNKSSAMDPTLCVPRCVTEPNESYVYEQFLKVENAEDVKAYTVGPDYCHAETRKSPVVDGIVKRDPNGKEIRYVTSLTKEEALMAAKIANGFGQRVCGFDLLRAGSKSYVVDVNGWSFVKDNNEYYDKSASILKSMFVLDRLRRDRANSVSTVDSETPTEPTTARKTSALKSVMRSGSISRIRDLGHAAQRHVTGHTSSAKTSPTLSSSVAEAETPAMAKAPTLDALPEHATAPIATHTNLVNKKEHITEAVDTETEAPPAPASKSQWKLKGMVAVIRHADRTPKQKFKFTFHTKPFVDLLKGHREEVLLVGEPALRSVQNAVETAIREGVEDSKKLHMLLNALERKGPWPGTKVQIKPMFRKKKTPDSSNGQSEAPKNKTEAQSVSASSDAPKLAGKAGRSESTTETTLSRITAAEDNLVLEKLQLVMKWGGESTHSARYQSQDLGENMRNDLLLMNPDALDDVSVFSSSEERVTTSAQIFASAFLGQDLDAKLINIRKDLLDDSNAAKDEMDRVKKKLKLLLRQGEQAPEQFNWPRDGTPEPYMVVRKVVELMKLHRRIMHRNFARLQSDAQTSLEQVRDGRVSSNGSPRQSMSDGRQSSEPIAAHIDLNSIQARWCAGEEADLFRERWEKLFEEFTEPEKVDPSKITELYDTMKFDALHNRQFLEWVFTPRAAADEHDDDLAKVHSPISPVPETSIGIEPDKHWSRPDAPVSDKAESSTFSRRSSQVLRGVLGRGSFAPSDYAQSDSHRPRYLQPSNSYFSLFTGDPTAASKARTDTRLAKLRDLYRLSKTLFDYIGPQEYGMLNSEKLEIGLLTSLPLLEEIVKDLEEVQAADDAKSFIYFTKESHIYTLLNCILEGGIQTKIARNAIPELDYLSQICFELYESENEAPLGSEHSAQHSSTSSINTLTVSDAADGAAASTDAVPDSSVQRGPQSFNYSIRITISPGCHTFDPLDVQLDSKHCIGCAPRRGLTPHADWKEVIRTLKDKFHTVKLPQSFLAINLSERAEKSDASPVASAT